MNDVFLGLDLSPTHFALVAVDRHGRFVGGYMATDKTTVKKLKQARSPVRCVEVPKLETRAPLAAKLARLESMKFRLVGAIHDLTDGAKAPIHISLENYAFGKANQAHQTGETGGVCRLAILNAGLRLRLYSPNSIKLYATGEGKAEKAQICEAMLARGAHALGATPKAAGAIDKHGDFYDAYAAAYMTLDEVMLRAGEITLQSLPDERRSAFIKTDESGENVLVQPWAFWPE